jgi:hypothetical protein
LLLASTSELANYDLLRGGFGRRVFFAPNPFLGLLAPSSRTPCVLAATCNVALILSCSLARKGCLENHRQAQTVNPVTI